MDNSEVAQEALTTLLDSCRGPVVAADVPVDGTAFDDTRIDALYEAANALDAAGQGAMLTAMAEAIGALHPYHAARLAMVAVAFVERWGDGGGALDAMLDRMAQAAPRAEDYFETAEAQGRHELEDAMPDELDPALDPEGYCAVAAVRFFALALRPLLAASMPARIDARTRPELVRMGHWLEQRCLMGAPRDVVELLTASDDEAVVVVCPAARRGAQFRTQAVRNCAHLYTLVNLVILENGVNLLGGWRSTFKKPSLGPTGQVVLEAARGGAEAYATLNPEQLFAGPLLLRPWEEIDPKDGFTPMSFTGIDAPMPAFRRLDGAIVLGAGDPEKHGPKRSWDIAFFEPLHENLRSDLVLEKELTKAEVGAWLKRIHDRG